ncbi:SusC/RagA family TonB-linked outer membrane protein [Pedobacter frigoris]|nr:SusC/RagA family TonB-linked outer membrane protein [Pedobacter frigoris]
MQVSAATFGQRITINQQNAPLSSVLKEIRKQSGYDIYADSKVISKDQKVSVALSDVSLEEALTATFKNLNITYKIDGKIISIKRKENPSFFENLVARFQEIDVSGKVVDETGKGLAGANVKVKGTNKVTTSNQDGEFLLQKVEENTVLEISYLGYVTKEIKSSKNLGIIRLDVATSDLEEVTINKGYYTTTKELNTGNVSEVKSDAIARQPITDILSAIQGNVPGLFIQQNSGVGGREFTVRLRGQNSLGNGNEPLYIVDGVPFNSTPLNSTRVTVGASSVSSPFAAINPADIESIQVLKDADATAIYGSRGANGVIIINTKRGQSGSTTVDVNVYSGVGNVTRTRPLLNTQEYLGIRREAFKNDNATPGPSDYDLNGTFALDKYTDWQELLIGGTAKVNDAQLAFSGGSQQTSFRFAGGFHKEGTVFPGDFYTQRASGSAAFAHTSKNNRLKLDFSGLYANNISRLPGTDLARFIFLAPNSPDVYTESGGLNFANYTWVNPLITAVEQNREASSNLNTNAKLSFQPVKGLFFKTGLGFNSVKFDQTHKQPTPSFNTEGFTVEQIRLKRTYNLSTSNLQTYVLEPQLSYTTNIKGGMFDAILGGTYQETTNSRLSQNASGFANDEVMNNLLVATAVSITENPIIKYRYNAIYGRIGYSYQQKYVINLTGRRDGSSRFGPGKQFGNFGAVGAAWLFGKEDFFKNFPILSSGKLRASFGTTGNDKLVDYQYLSTYTGYAFTYQGNPSQFPSQLTNPYFAWERVNKLEVGMDVGMMDEQINITASWYRNRTINQLVGYSLSEVTGFKSIQANLPAVLQNSGVEMEVSFDLQKKRGLNWNTSLNLTFPRSKLVAYPNLAGSGTYANRYEVGMPLEIRKLYRYTGVDPNTKLFTFEDVNKDGLISSPQDLRISKIGQDFYGAWNNNVTYKRLQLDVVVTFAKQTGAITPFNNLPGAYGGGTGNQLKSILNGEDYPQSYSQNFTTPIANQMLLYRFSDSQLADASYLRLRNVSLSWKFSEDWKFMRLGKVFIQCQNLLTITNFQGLDPETSRIAYQDVVPPLRVATLGLQFML